MIILVYLFTIITIVFHLVAFLWESVFWMKPVVYENIVAGMATPEGISLQEHARILEGLFFNQGFYNLFIALGAIAGLVLFKKGSAVVGKTLICYTNLFALGAGLVLAFSSTAYMGAILQAGPALLALIALYLSSRRDP
ncbi:MAG: DUF1304 domain-containing protein [Xanthomonadales bacterium]|nr:DUF1304 domain-containing protein [Xanthomonadales bacterium]